MNNTVRSRTFNDKNECLYPRPGPNAPVKQQGTKLSERRLHPEVLPMIGQVRDGSSRRYAAVPPIARAVPWRVFAFLHRALSVGQRDAPIEVSR